MVQELNMPESEKQKTNNPKQIKLTVDVAGMHCRSCELLIENEFKDFPGVQKVSANADRGQVKMLCSANQLPSREIIDEKLKKHGYRIGAGKQAKSPSQDTHAKKPRFLQILGAFAVVLAVGFLLSKLGLLKINTEINGATGFFAILILGLIAASSSCIAVSGGLLLSVVERVSDRYELMPGKARMLPVSIFVAGRIVGYTVLGGLVAGIGKALSPSPLVTGLIAIAAAIFMFVMGLDMLHIAPRWLKAMMPRTPKFIGRKVLDDQKHNHYFSPFIFGALTFFLPCGFTQALQIYVLSTGNILTGAMTMFAFALGTAPALLALGWASNALKGKAGQIFFRFAGAAVIVLGLYNFSNGLAITGHPISWPSFPKSSVAQNVSQTDDPNVVADGDVQVVKTSFTSSGYSPTTFTVKAGKRVRWEVDGAGYAGGCRSFLQIPKLNVGKAMQGGVNVIEFTPTDPGTYNFSCGMGMYRGEFTVVN
ncbi:MAG: sulfite exporter TauE/SafE family protein [Patescibacteria group bacterium]|jgi:sulfite exporter TauE/SafE/copper chaperone CopZ